MSDNKRTMAIVGAFIGVAACVGIGTSIAYNSNEEVYERELTVNDYLFLDTAREYAKIPVSYNEEAVDRGRNFCRNINRADTSIAIKDEQNSDRVEYSMAIALAALDEYCPQYKEFATKEVEKYYGIVR
jgi:uncharacterized protein YcfJ